MAKNIRILITGINGFIGSNLETYIKTGRPSWQIYGIDSKSFVSPRRFKLDITADNEKLKVLLSRIKPRYIFHCAGIVSGLNFKQLFYSNVLTTYNLLLAIRKIKGYYPRIVIPSSASEYGLLKRSQLPAREDYLLKPFNAYGLSKTMQTQTSLMFMQEGLDIAIARIFNILGKGIGTNLSIGKFSKELSLIKKNKQKPILFTKSLNTKRDFLDIQDVCKCILAIALYGVSGGVYNVCRGKSFTIRSLLTKLIKISGISNVKVIEDTKNNLKEISDSYGSLTKLKGIYKNFKPKPIEKSLEENYRYCLSQS